MAKDILLAAALLTLVIGFVWAFGVKIAEEPTVTTDVVPPPRMTVEGTWGCVPLKSGLLDSECVQGIARDQSDAHFVVDTQFMAANLQVKNGDRVRIEGIFTPAVALSSSHWQKYIFDGIISASVVQKI